MPNSFRIFHVNCFMAGTWWKLLLAFMCWEIAVKVWFGLKWSGRASVPWAKGQKTSFCCLCFKSLSVWPWAQGESYVKLLLYKLTSCKLGVDSYEGFKHLEGILRVSSECLCYICMYNIGNYFIQVYFMLDRIALLFHCLVAQLCRTLCDPVDCSPPGSSVHGVSQARMLEWVAIPFFRGSSQLRD